MQSVHGKSYSETFFADRKPTALSSAQQVAPWILARMKIRSVVDVGCGTGSWLAAFAEHGLTDLIGFDGPWVPLDRLEIPSERFVGIDFTHLEDFPVCKSFDLVICLEVAEHLPLRLAEHLVDILTRLGRAVLFSAAIPRQGGVGHQNEQWPAFWITLFKVRGYVCFDVIRGAFWENPRVAPWYAQNSFLFIAKNEISKHPAVAEEAAINSLAGKPLVHPRQYDRKIEELSDPRNQSLKAVLRLAPSRVWLEIRRSLREVTVWR